MSQEDGLIEHDLKVWLEPDKNQLVVEDRITVLNSFSLNSTGQPHFLLYAGLNPVSTTPGIELVPIDKKTQAKHFGIKMKSVALNKEIPMDLFRLTLPDDQKTFSINYQGKLNHPLRKTGKEYSRGFSETQGIISSEGVFLSGNSKPG